MLFPFCHYLSPGPSWPFTSSLGHGILESASTPAMLECIWPSKYPSANDNEFGKQTHKKQLQCNDGCNLFWAVAISKPKIKSSVLVRRLYFPATFPSACSKNATAVWQKVTKTSMKNSKFKHGIWGKIGPALFPLPARRKRDAHGKPKNTHSRERVRALKHKRNEMEIVATL